MKYKNTQRELHIQIKYTKLHDDRFMACCGLWTISFLIQVCVTTDKRTCYAMFGMHNASGIQSTTHFICLSHFMHSVEVFFNITWKLGFFSICGVSFFVIRVICDFLQIFFFKCKHRAMSSTQFFGKNGISVNATDEECLGAYGKERLRKCWGEYWRECWEERKVSKRVLKWAKII